MSAEIKNSIDSATRNSEKAIEKGLYDQTMGSQSSSVGVKSEVRAREPPGLSYGSGARVCGLIPKTLPPRGKLPEMDTDSIMTENDNPTQIRKTVEKKVAPTITFSDSAQEMQTEPIPAQRLPMEQEPAPKMQGDQPWADYGWNYYSWGMPMTMPMYLGETCQGRKTRVVEKGGHRHLRGQV